MMCQHQLLCRRAIPPITKNVVQCVHGYIAWRYADSGRHTSRIGCGLVAAACVPLFDKVHVDMLLQAFVSVTCCCRHAEPMLRVRTMYGRFYITQWHTVHIANTCNALWVVMCHQCGALLDRSPGMLLCGPLCCWRCCSTTVVGG